MPDTHDRLEEVLLAFSVEEDHGSETLKRYLEAHAEFAEELIDLSIELTAPQSSADHALTPRDEELVKTAYERNAVARQVEQAFSLFELPIAMQRQLAEALGVPRQVVTSLREAKVLVETIPKHIIQRIAAVVGQAVEVVTQQLSMGGTLARSNKADGKPQVANSATFEQVLIEAGVSEEKRNELLRVGE